MNGRCCVRDCSVCMFCTPFIANQTENFEDSRGEIEESKTRKKDSKDSIPSSNNITTQSIALNILCKNWSIETGTAPS